MRVPDDTFWELRLRPEIQRLAAELGATAHDVEVGPVRIRLVTNDDHLKACLEASFPAPEGEREPDGVAHALVGIDDEETLRRLLGIENENDLADEHGRFDEERRDPHYRLGLPEDDPGDAAAKQRMLHRPFAYVSPDQRRYILINDNDYGEVRARGVIGLAEAHLAATIEIDERKRVQGTDEAWALLPGTVVTLPGRGAMLLLGAEDSRRRCLGVGLGRWKDGVRCIPEAVALVRLGDRKVVLPEKRYFVRADLERLVPALAEPIAGGAVENTDRGADRSGPSRRGRALVGTDSFPGGSGPVEEPLTDIVLVRRDYDDPHLLREITFREAMDLLTGPSNTPVHDPGRLDLDRYAPLLGRTTIPYFSSSVLHTEIDREAGSFGDVDRKRIAVLLHLAKEGGVRFILANPRLPFDPIQYCARKFFSGGAEVVEVLKGKEVPDDPIWALGLKKQSKPAKPGRRELDLMGFFREGDEAEVVAFHRGGKISELVAFQKGARGRAQVMASSLSDVDFFFRSEAALGVEELFGGE